MSELLAGRRAFITGGARGIGAATAARFCEEGARVVVADRDAAGAEAAAEGLRASGHRAQALSLDVTDEGGVAAALGQAAELMEGVDTVVANAGVLDVTPIEDLALSSFERVLKVNLVGVFLTFKHATALLRDSGGGVLLATASQAGLRGCPEMTAYCASKFGVVGLVQSLAPELAADGIRVCAVAPGITRTQMYADLVERRSRIWEQEPDEVIASFEGGIPLARPATPTDVANGHVYLASSLAGYVSGAVLTLDGGELSG